MKLLRLFSILALLATLSCFGMKSPHRQKSYGQDFLPTNLWQRYLSIEEAPKYIWHESITKTDDVTPGELVIYYSGTTNQYHFAKIKSKNKKSIIFTRYDASLSNDCIFKLLCNLGNVEANKFYRLRSFWRWIWQPSVCTELFLNAMEDFQQIPEYQYTGPHGKTLIINTENHVIPTGDLHADFLSLQHNLRKLYNNEFCGKVIDEDGFLAPGYHLLFTGDIVDRGEYGVECWYVLMRLAYHNPGRVHIVRGNHEYADIACEYGFFDEFIKKIGINHWANIKNIWEQLPLLYLIGVKTPGDNFYDFLMFSHAGFDPQYNVAELMRIAIDAGAEIQSVPVPNSPNYNWSDLEPSRAPEATTLVAAGIRPGNRGANEERMNRAAVRGYCKIASNTLENACLSGIFRGHDHQAGAICNNIGKLIDHAIFPWKQLESHERYPLSENFDVYTIISAPNVPTVGCARNYAYGIIKASSNGRWYLRPITEKLDS